MVISKCDFSIGSLLKLFVKNLFFCSNRNIREERSRWDTVADPEHGRIRRNSGSHSQSAIGQHSLNATQRIPPSTYDGRDNRAMYNSETDRWNRERYEH